MILDKFKQYGWSFLPRVIKAGLRKVGLVFEIFYLLRLDLDAVNIDSAIQRFDYDDVRELFANDLSLFKGITLQKKKVFLERFNSNDYSCFAVVKGGELAYYTWVSWRIMGYPDFFEKHELLRSDEALLEDSYCYPAFRGSGLHLKMNFFRLRKIKQAGMKKVLALVLKENRPALKVQLKSGFKFHKTICYLSIWGNKKIMEVTK